MIFLFVFPFSFELHSRRPWDSPNTLRGVLKCHGAHRDQCAMFEIAWAFLQASFLSSIRHGHTVGVSTVSLVYSPKASLLGVFRPSERCWLAHFFSCSYRRLFVDCCCSASLVRSPCCFSSLSALSFALYSVVVMVFTGAQTLAFFTNAAQMAIPQATYQAMANENIVNVQDLVELDEEAMKLVVAYLRKPGDHIPHPQA